MASASGPVCGRIPGVCLLPALIATFLTPGALGAQGLPHFDATQLACTLFGVRVTTNVTTDLQGTQRVEAVRREGRLVVRGTAVDSGIAIEAWWDSLTLSRRAGTEIGRASCR